MWFVLFLDLDYGVWIGGDDLDNDGVYRWRLTGHQIAVPGFGWNSGEPNMAKPCVKFAGPDNSQNLVTSRCTSNQFVVCEE